MSPEQVNIALTAGNVAAVIALVIITCQYTKATKRMARLQEQRKVWEVEPVVAPLDKIVVESQYEMTAIVHGQQTWEPRTRSFRIIGIKNVGRGVAGIDKTDCTLARSSDYWMKTLREYTLPMYLGVGEEFIFGTLEKDSDIKSRDILLEVSYEDVHGNRYRTEYKFGELKRYRVTKQPPRT